MATWDQGLSAGNFLAGIGQSNSNAPQVGAVNPTLGMIRENNDFTRAGGNNVLTQGLQGLVGLKDQYQQQQQQEAMKAFNQVHANAWKSGDTSTLRDFAVANPAFVAQAQQAMSGLNEQQRADMGNMAMRANVALSQGPEVYAKFVQDNQADFKRVGADPNWMLQNGLKNPEQLSHLTTMLSLGAVGPEKAFEVQDKQQGRTIAQQNADTSTYSAQQGVRQGDERIAIDRFKAQTGSDLQAQALNLDAMYKKATTDNARANIQQKIGQVKQAMNEKVGGLSNNIAAVSSNIAQMAQLGKIVNDDPSIVSGAIGLGSQGMVGRYIPTLSQSSREFESRRDQVLGSLLTDGSLKATFGNNPTEGERAAMEKSISTLKSATTPEQFNAELNRLQQRSVDMAKRQISSLGIKKVPLSADKESAAVNYLAQNPDQVGAFIQDHGYLPEGYWRVQAQQQ
ncbi:TPA: phage DNA ejection protein [Serratia marcescens]